MTFIDKILMMYNSQKTILFIQELEKPNNYSMGTYDISNYSQDIPFSFTEI